MHKIPISAAGPRVVERFRDKEAVAAPAGKIGILLVDDQDELRRFLACALKQAGYWVVEAPSGEDALDLLPNISGIQLLITDVMMPGINGAELARRVLAARLELKVLFISGCAGHILEPGSPFLQKPFTMGTLLREVAVLLGLPIPFPVRSKTA